MFLLKILIVHCAGDLWLIFGVSARHTKVEAVERCAGHLTSRLKRDGRKTEAVFYDRNFSSFAGLK